EAMSAVVDNASLPLSWRERETRVPARRAKRMASVIVLSLTEDDDHRAGKDQRQRREILEPGDAFGEAEEAPAVGGEREENLTRKPQSESARKGQRRIDRRGGEHDGDGARNAAEIGPERRMGSVGFGRAVRKEPQQHQKDDGRDSS